MRINRASSRRQLGCVSKMYRSTPSQRSASQRKISFSTFSNISHGTASTDLEVDLYMLPQT
jgi:hypothetical protein